MGSCCCRSSAFAPAESTAPSSIRLPCRANQSPKFRGSRLSPSIASLKISASKRWILRPEPSAPGVRPRFPYLLIGLYLGTVELARLQNIETLFVMTEPRLARHFRKLGVRIQTVGAPVEHHGMRIPSMMKISTVRAELKAIFRSLYGSIAKTIVAGLNRAH